MMRKNSVEINLKLHIERAYHVPENNNAEGLTPRRNLAEFLNFREREELLWANDF